MLVALGIGLVVLGLLVWSGALSWFGRLPGDVRVERESVRVYVPLVSMLVVSAALSLLLTSFAASSSLRFGLHQVVHLSPRLPSPVRTADSQAAWERRAK